MHLLEHFDRVIYSVPYLDAHFMDLTILYYQWQGNLTTGLTILILISRLIRISRASYYCSILMIIVVDIGISLKLNNKLV